MKTLLFLLLLLPVTIAVNAQAIPSAKATYANWLYLNNSNHVLKGVILATDDSTVLFIDRSFLVAGKVIPSYQLQVIPIAMIEKIKFRKRNSLAKSTLLGTAAGAAVGAIVGYASGDDECYSTGGWFDCMFVYSAEEKAGLGAVIGILPGMTIGLLLGSSRKTIHINGDQGVYVLTRDELRKYTLSGE
ncbi:hypothetical protein [Pontibacter fetidus]|uniref:Uncharacterized protein n=1 Tax=Pontibacter fetidus TaxID=2700082 RepID=A0A6B2H3H1_9BACT|nr:hypothetical protein [Pontibacter fetidus]NDK56961.1 hypothetical protein [Pontibacter fetidus]